MEVATEFVLHPLIYTSLLFNQPLHLVSFQRCSRAASIGICPFAHQARQDKQKVSKFGSRVSDRHPTFGPKPPGGLGHFEN